MGLINHVFNADSLKKLYPSNLGIGHTRYSTSGISELQNCQPFVVETLHGKIAVAHNGELTNATQLRRKVSTSSGDSGIVSFWVRQKRAIWLLWLFLNTKLFGVMKEHPNQNRSFWGENILRRGFCLDISFWICYRQFHIFSSMFYVSSQSIHKAN